MNYLYFLFWMFIVLGSFLFFAVYLVFNLGAGHWEPGEPAPSDGQRYLSIHSDRLRLRAVLFDPFFGVAHFNFFALRLLGIGRVGAHQRHDIA